MNKSSYDLSVIIPFFNVETRLIKKAIDSILRDNAVSIEVILVNDGSDNQYIEEVRELITHYDDIVLLSQNRRGVSSARNYGIREAKGKYITLLDADDQFTLHFIKDIKKLLPNNYDFILGGTRIVQENEDIDICLEGNVFFYNTKEEIRKWKPRLYGRPYIFSKAEKVFLNIGVAGKVIKASIAKAIPVNESLRIAEDCLWNQQLIAQVKTLVVVEQIWYLYLPDPI